MKINSIINRYIFREMLSPFMINLFFLSLVFLLSQILEITNLVVNYNVSLSVVFRLIAYSMPEFLRFTIPMSVMMGVLMTFLKMAADNEIIAIKAGGCSVYHLVYPVAFFCLIGAGLTFFMSVYANPWGKNAYNELEYEIATQGADAAIKERVFNDSINNIVFYVNEVSMTDKYLHDVFIEDMRNDKNRSTVVAPKGKRFVDPDKKDAFIMRLFNGMIFRVNLEDNSVNTIRFDTYDITIPVKKGDVKTPTGDKRHDELTLDELLAYIKNEKNPYEQRRLAKAELHEKLSLPFACLTLGLLALPLGLKSAFSKKSSGMGLGLGCFIMYYALFAFGWSSAKGRLMSPSLSMWLPNIVMGIVGFYFFIRVSRERPIGFEFIGQYYRTYKQRKLNTQK